MENSYLCTDSATTVRRWRKVDLMDLVANFEPETHLTFTDNIYDTLTSTWWQLQSKVVVSGI